MNIYSLRNKFLLSVAGISIVVIVVAMLSVSWLISQQYLQQSNEHLSNAIRIINDSLLDKKDNQLLATRQLAMQKNLGTTIWYLSQYAQEDVDREMLFMTYRQLVKDTYKIARVAKFSKITLYDAAGHLISFARFQNNTEMVGFAEYHPRRLFRVATLQKGEELNRSNLRTMRSVASISFKFNGPLPKHEITRYSAADGKLFIESLVPILGEAFDPVTGEQQTRQLGLVVTEQHLDQDFVDTLASLTEIKINLFTPQGYSAGNLPDYRQPDWKGLQPGTDSLTSSNEITLNGKHYYQRLIPLHTGTQLAGSIAALQSQHNAQKNTEEMMQILGLIALSSLLFIVPFAWYFATSITRPLTTLSRIFHGVASGNQINPLNDELGKLKKIIVRSDELGEMTQSFIDMNDAIKQKIQQINKINVSLEAKVEQRTQALAIANKELTVLAAIDSLTGLPNRRLMQDRLQQAIAAVARSGQHGALFFIDLDNFKKLNDTLGHDMGDLLLQQVATRLTTCVREGDTVARLGGDEFVVMLTDLSEQPNTASEQAEATGNQILSKIMAPHQLAQSVYRVSCSIGVTLFNHHKESVEELLKQADIAMYQSKKAGRGTLHFFDPKMQIAVNERAALDDDLHKAIEHQQFQIYYQAQTDNANIPFGAEVLLRWQHPENGLMSPAQFIPLAEETGLIKQIGQWVLESACMQLSLWQKDAITRDLSLSINVSAKQFHQADCVSQVRTALQRHAIVPALLTLELTESVLLENIEDTITKMHALKEIGVRFSLDDFGTGYSSLQYLKRLPLDQFKIDQSFVQDIAVDGSDQAIVRTIIAMARTLNLDVIAEGVETAEQKQLLMDCGCTHFQGYLFGEPVIIEAFEENLKRI